MTKIKCAHTTCIHNPDQEGGYICKKSNVELIWIPPTADTIGRTDQMICLDKVTKPKRGKCGCGGYFQDWHSHASECIVINPNGKNFNK